MEIGAFACVDRARHSVRADQGPQTIDYLYRPEIFGRAKSRAWEEAWAAALPLALTWALALVAALE